MIKKIILTIVCALFAADAYSAQKPAFSAADFSCQIGAVSAAVQAAPVSLPAPVCARVKSGHLVPVSGFVTLHGNGWMPQNGGFTSVSLTGSATFRDATGKITSSSVFINTSASMYVYPNKPVYQTVWANVSAQFYSNGKPIGSTYLTGGVSLSGWPNSSSFSLSGSGQLTGSIFVAD